MSKIIHTIFETAASAYKIIAGYVLGALAFGFCICVSWNADPAAHYLYTMLCILGGLIGWIVGLCLTPSSDHEERKVSEFGRGLVGIATGFGLAHTDQTVVQIWSASTAPTDPKTAIPVLLFACCLLIGGLFTYIGRLHVRGSDELLKEQRNIAWAKLDDALSELRKAS